MIEAGFGDLGAFNVEVRRLLMSSDGVMAKRVRSMALRWAKSSQRLHVVDVEEKRVEGE